MQTTQVATILLIPVLDMARLFAVRLIRGGHPFAADHSHLHHHLDAAFGWSRGRLVYYGLVAAPILLMRSGAIPSIACLGVGLVLYLATLIFATLHTAGFRPSNRFRLEN
jgi:hypothetical protein